MATAIRQFALACDVCAGRTRRRFRARRSALPFLHRVLTLSVYLVGSCGWLLISQTQAQAAYTNFLPSLIVNRPIAFASDREENFNQDLYLMDADGSNVTRVAGPDSVMCPGWSPDGRHLVVATLLDFDIWRVDEDGEGSLQLTSGTEIDHYPVWSPKGDWIAYSTNRWPSGGLTGLRVIRPDGTGEASLIEANTSGVDYWQPAWSPDGLRLAFSSDMAGGDPEIYVADVDFSSGVPELGALTQLTDLPGWDMAPRWSPDGVTISFASDRDGDYEIYTMSRTGADVRQLTANSSVDTTPAWSPDGKQIVFVSDRDSNAEIYVMDRDGSTQTNVTQNPARDVCPAWK